MLLYLPIGCETDATLLTFKRLLASVCSHVSFKIANLVKLLQAATEGADEDLRITLRPPHFFYLA